MRDDGRWKSESRDCNEAVSALTRFLLLLLCFGSIQFPDCLELVGAEYGLDGIPHLFLDVPCGGICILEVLSISIFFCL